jgi:hypothetical protein
MCNQWRFSINRYLESIQSRARNYIIWITFVSIHLVVVVSRNTVVVVSRNTVVVVSRNTVVVSYYYRCCFLGCMLVQMLGVVWPL